MNTANRRSGITLLEILIVTTIGILLMFMFLPIFSAVKKRTMRTECLSNLKQIGTALQLYAQDNNEMLPCWRNRRTDEKGVATIWDSPENLSMAVTLKSREPRIMFCPTDDYARKDIQVFGVNHKFSSYFFNMQPMDSPDGNLTITGLILGGSVAVPPADYPMVRDCNLDVKETVDGKPARGCQHLGEVNIIYVDLHIEHHKVKDGVILGENKH